MTANKYTNEELETALRISPLFYDAVLDETRWPDALSVVANFCDGSRGASAHIFKISPPTLYANYSWNMSEQDAKFFLSFDDHQNGDPRFKEHLKRPNMPFHCRMLVDDKTMRASPIYTQVFKRINVEYTLGVGIYNEELNYGFSLGVFRGREHQPFTEASLNRISLLLPHLRRVADIYIRLTEAENRFMQANKLLSEMKLAIVFVNKLGDVVFQNKSAQSLLENMDGIQLNGERLMHTSSLITAKILDNVKEIAVADMIGQRPKAKHLVVPRPAAGAPLQATFCSLASYDGPNFESFSERGFVAIYFSDPLAVYESDTEQLQRIFGLTTAEAGVLKHLAGGESLKEISTNSRRSLETIRGHSKSLLFKMNAKRQSDLVRMALNVLDPLDPN